MLNIYLLGPETWITIAKNRGKTRLGVKIIEPCTCQEENACKHWKRVPSTILVAEPNTWLMSKGLWSFAHRGSCHILTSLFGCRCSTPRFHPNTCVFQGEHWNNIAQPGKTQNDWLSGWQIIIENLTPRKTSIDLKNYGFQVLKVFFRVCIFRCHWFVFVGVKIGCFLRHTKSPWLSSQWNSNTSTQVFEVLVNGFEIFESLVRAFEKVYMYIYPGSPKTINSLVFRKNIDFCRDFQSTILGDGLILNGVWLTGYMYTDRLNEYPWINEYLRSLSSQFSCRQTCLFFPVFQLNAGCWRSNHKKGRGQQFGTNWERQLWCVAMD